MLRRRQRLPQQRLQQVSDDVAALVACVEGVGPPAVPSPMQQANVAYQLRPSENNLLMMDGDGGRRDAACHGGIATAQSSCQHAFQLHGGQAEGREGV